MSPNSFNEVFAAAKQLPRKDQERLVEELSRIVASNGAALTPEIGRAQTLYDVLEASGLVGFMTEGPGDLSTNPEHMEGFGRDAG
jgi:hypothetical protein